MIDTTAAAYALLLGAVAAFNPCGFALLPAYITVIITGSAEDGVTRAKALRRAVGFGLAMTLGFMIIFTGFGLLFGAVNLGLQGSILPYVSYVTVVIGAVLIWLGIILLRGGELKGPGLRIQGAAPRKSFWSQVGYGASFALASMSCTIGLFLAIVAQSLAATGPVAAVAPFLIYGAGMGTSILAVSILAAVAGSAAAAALRSKTPLLMRIGGGLMVLAGGYVLLFGLAEVLPRWGIDVLNPVLITTAEWQAAVTQWIESWGTTALVVAFILVTAATIIILVKGKQADARAAEAATASASVEDEGDADAVALTTAADASEGADSGDAPAAAKPGGIQIASQGTLDAIRGSTKK